MICYKDQSFCNSNCINASCHRNFTDYHRANARKWWSHDPDNAPIAFMDFSKDCEDYKT